MIKSGRTSLVETPPPGFVLRTKGIETLIVQKKYGTSRPLSEILTGEPRLPQTARTALSGGRGSTSVHAIAGIGDVVLRRYRRGGLIGKVLFDRYISSSRPFRELAVLVRARTLGVPVPEVVGASSTRAGLLWHRGRIATRLIPGSWTLPVFIGENRNDAALVSDVLKRAGGAIRKMHDAGIDHADLNMNNILVDKKGAVYIIDFDKAAVYPELGQRRRIRNLRRLLRSLRKLKSMGVSLEDGDFSIIIKGYAGDEAYLARGLERKTLRSGSLMLRTALRMIFRRHEHNNPCN
jgi:3-deoxy-D-manno-octulosonic acid kinase